MIDGRMGSCCFLIEDIGYFLLKRYKERGDVA